MKKITAAVVFIYFLATVMLMAQKAELVQRFDFSDPFFSIRETWAEDGGPGGPNTMSILNESHFLLYSTNTNSFRIYGMKESLKMLGENTRPVSSLYHTWGYRAFSSGRIIGSMEGPKLFLLGNPNNAALDYIPLIEPKEINPGDVSIDDIPYKTGNMLFGRNSNNELVSWELSGNGQSVFRGVNDTAAWLEVHGEELGYHSEKSHYQCFGENQVQDNGTYRWAIFDKLVSSQTVEPVESAYEYSYFGSDRLGISYFYGDILEKQVNPVAPEKRWMKIYAIVDPWTKRVAYRVLPPGQFTPLYSTRIKDLIINTDPNAVSPSGDIYFFDADRAAKAYQLKRVKNDWWAELGATDRRVGRILGNHIPLRKQPSDKADFDGYNFENEYVWQLDKNIQPEKVDGKAFAWLRVRKLDGREGWIPENSVVFQ